MEAEAAPPPPHQPLRRPGCKPGEFSILPSHTSLTPESLQPTNLNVIKKYFKEPSKLSKYLSSVAQKGQTGQVDGQVGRGHTPTPFPGLPVNKQGIWRFWAFHLSGSNPQPGYPVSCALANTTQAVKHLGPSPLIENLWQLEESGCVFPKL